MTRDEINKTIFENQLKEIDIAKAIHVANSTLNYQLHTAKMINPEILNAVESYLKRKGYLISESQKCNKLVKTTLNIGAMMGHGLSVLNTEVSEASEDGQLSYKERFQISTALNNLEADIKNSIDEIRKLVEG